RLETDISTEISPRRAVPTRQPFPIISQTNTSTQQTSKRSMPNSLKFTKSPLSSASMTEATPITTSKQTSSTAQKAVLPISITTKHLFLVVGIFDLVLLLIGFTFGLNFWSQCGIVLAIGM